MHTGYRLLCILFQGLPSKLLFAHHGPPSCHYSVTHYEESYGSKHTNALPTVRPWHRDSLTWQRERSDRPISGKSLMGQASTALPQGADYTWEMIH